MITAVIYLVKMTIQKQYYLYQRHACFTNYPSTSMKTRSHKNPPVILKSDLKSYTFKCLVHLRSLRFVIRLGVAFINFRLLT